MYNSQINKLCETKKKEIKNIVGLIKKDDLNNKKTKTILLIKDLIRNINKHKKFSYMSFNDSRRINNNNNNTNKNITCTKSSRKQSTSKNKNKNDVKKMENKNYKMNEKKNSNLNNEYFKIQLTNNKINKKRDMQNINKENNKIYTQRISGNLKKRGCVINKELDLVLKHKSNVSQNNLINNKKNKINICSEYLSQNRKSKKNHRVMFVYNIKNQMKLDENQTWFNRTMAKENKILGSSIIKKNKKKSSLLNITSNSNNKDFSLSIKSQNNNKNKNTKELNLRNNKNKKKIKLQILTPSISSLIIKEHKLSSRIKKNSKINNFSNDANMTSILNKYTNDSFNKKKI